MYAVEVDNLSFSYPDGRQALYGLNLRVQSGERVALVGPNGAGKSTFLLHLNGILRGSGTVRVLGQEVAEPRLPEIRAQVGLVFQDPDDQLFSLTVAEDVGFGPLHMGLPRAEIDRRVAQALAQVGMGAYTERTPYHLSGGEKKQVALATVLSMEPAILALDEPTAGLDPRARRRLIAVLASLPQTMLVSTHDMRLVAALLPRTVILDRGRVVADGPTREILADARLLETHGLESPYEPIPEIPAQGLPAGASARRTVVASSG